MHDKNLRSIIPDNPNVTEEMLFDLAKDSDEYTRRSVARSEYATPNVLARLAYDEDSIIRSMVAANRNIAKESVDILKKDASENVLIGLIHNQSVDSGTLEELSHSDYEKVFSSAKRSLASRKKSRHVDKPLPRIEKPSRFDL